LKKYELIVEGRLSEKPLTVEMSRRLNARIDTYRSERDVIGLSLSRSHEAHKTKALLLQKTSLVRVKAAPSVPPLFKMFKPRSSFVQQVKSVRIKHG
ncbi:phage tail protein, partial [Photobacterium sp. WH24]|nr:phage tail protein [Photobacterium sp. WH24]